MYGDELKNMLVGRKIKKIFFNENNLKFVTDDGDLVFSVYGDCCSVSYFYDFYGVKNLLKNGKIIDVREVSLTEDDFKNLKHNAVDRRHGYGINDVGDVGGEIMVYGYQIITESKKFGEVTSVFSFRNYSNGYYGGSLEVAGDVVVLPEIKDDVVESASVN